MAAVTKPQLGGAQPDFTLGVRMPSPRTMHNISGRHRASATASASSTGGGAGAGAGAGAGSGANRGSPGRPKSGGRLRAMSPITPPRGRTAAVPSLPIGAPYADPPQKSPPSTVQLLSGMSTYAHEQYMNSARHSLRTTQFFDVDKQRGRDGRALKWERDNLPEEARIKETERIFVAANQRPAVAYESEAASANRGVKAPTGLFRPKFVEFDRQVLCFQAYFHEPVKYSRIEHARQRRVEVRFYLVDNTLEVVEPEQDNSGLPQGTFLKRHVAYHDGTNRPVVPTDLAIGASVDLLGRRYHIVGADAATRRIVAERFGMTLREDVPYPPEPYTPAKASFTVEPKATTIASDVGFEEDSRLGFYRRQPDTLQKFLANDRKVLSFGCVWDDTKRMFGERRNLRINFYLADDTMEIVEPLRDNSGRGPFSRMLSRQRVPLPWADRNTLLGKVPTKAPVTPPRAPPGGRKLQSRTPPRGDGVFASMVPCDASSGSRVASAPQRLAAGSDTARARAEAAVAAVEAAGGGGGVTHKPGCCHAKRSPDGGAPDRPPSSSSGGSTGRRSVRDAMPLHAAGQRPRSARAARPSTGFVDRFERRPGVSPITGLPLYRPGLGERPQTAPGPGCQCGSTVAAAKEDVASALRHDGHVAPSVGAVASGAGIGTGLPSHRLATLRPPIDYYTARDLLCGRTVRIFDRDLKIKDCDSYTRQWYRTKMGIEQEDVPDTPPPTPGIDLKLPPGKESLRPDHAPAIGAISKAKDAPPPGSTRIILHPEHEGKIVRCAMRLSHADPDQSGRRFVLTYFLEDASLSVFEQALPNSGHPGGKFMERDVYRNCTGVDPDIAYSVVPRLFEAGDFAVGSKLRFHHAPHQEFEVLATEQAAVPGSRAALAIQAAAAAGRGATDPEQAAAVVAARNATIARMSWRLQGRLGTFQKALESFDWRNTGGVHRVVLTALLRQMGVDSAAGVDDDALDAALARYENAREQIDYKGLVAELRRAPVPTEPLEVALVPGGGVGAGAGAGADAGESVKESIATKAARARSQLAEERQEAAVARAAAEAEAAAAAAAPPKASPQELLFRRLRLLLGAVGPRVLMHFFRHQDAGRSGVLGAKCFFAALDEASLPLTSGDRAFLKSSLFPTSSDTARPCLDYARLMRVLFGSMTSSKS